MHLDLAASRSARGRLQAVAPASFAIVLATAAVVAPQPVAAVYESCLDLPDQFSRDYWTSRYRWGDVHVLYLTASEFTEAHSVLHNTVVVERLDELGFGHSSRLLKAFLDQRLTISPKEQTHRLALVAIDVASMRAAYRDYNEIGTLTEIHRWNEGDTRGVATWIEYQLLHVAGAACASQRIAQALPGQGGEIAPGAAKWAGVFGDYFRLAESPWLSTERQARLHSDFQTVIEVNPSLMNELDDPLSNRLRAEFEVPEGLDFNPVSPKQGEALEALIVGFGEVGGPGSPWLKDQHLDLLRWLRRPPVADPRRLEWQSGRFMLDELSKVPRQFRAEELRRRHPSR